MKTFFKGFKQRLAELLVIAFGVVLGMVLNQWNNNRQVSNNTQKTKEHILSELDLNITRLEETISYHEELCISIDEFKSEIPEDEFLKPYYLTKYKHFKISGWKGPRLAGLENIVFESAKINGFFQEVDIDQTQLIARAYMQQDAYLDFSRSSINRLITIDSGTKLIDVVGTLELICSDVLNQEKYLLRNLTSIKESLEK